MSDLRLADEVIQAAEYISSHEETDVEVLWGDGSHFLYIKGDDETPIRWAAPMPQMEPGKAPSYLDLTPKQIRLGRWHEEVGEFIPSNSLSVENFLELHRLAIHQDKR
jgi:hypothetical protein